MDYRYQYNNDVERITLMASNSDKYLVEQQFLKEGNFLIFSDKEREIRYHTEIEKIKNEDLLAIQDNQLTIMEAIADLYSTIDTV